jgi:hypothetical protein
VSPPQNPIGGAARTVSGSLPDIPQGSGNGPSMIRSMRIDRGRAYQEVDKDQIVLWDLDLAAWLLVNGMGVVDIWREGAEFRLVFWDPEHRIRELHIEFLNSICAKFATAVKQIKKAAHSVGARPPGPPPRR